MIKLLPWVAAAFASAASLKFLPTPWLYTLLVWVAAFVFAAVRARTSNPRAIALNAAVFFAVMAGFEVFGYFGMQAASAVDRTYSDGYKSRDSMIGSRPAPNVVGHSELRDGSRLIYSVDYTVGPDGLRVPPPVAAEPLLGCVLFFGDSFTFGEGVGDTQTMPYQVGLMTGGRYRIYNFSFHGYGPQQMLATLQLGLYRDIIACQPTHVIYQALVDHAARAAGIFYWTEGSPRYRLQPDGTVTAAGHYGDEREERNASVLARNLDYQLSKSYFMRWLSRRARQPTMADAKLWAAMVLASRDYVRQHFPNAEYHVLFSDARNSEGVVGDLALAMRRDLEKEGISLHVMESILPDYERLHAKYELDPIDTHPNAVADEIIARYVATHILQTGAAD